MIKKSINFFNICIQYIYCFFYNIFNKKQEQTEEQPNNEDITVIQIKETDEEDITIIQSQEIIVKDTTISINIKPIIQNSSVLCLLFQILKMEYKPFKKYNIFNNIYGGKCVLTGSSKPTRAHIIPQANSRLLCDNCKDYCKDILKYYSYNIISMELEYHRSFDTHIDWTFDMNLPITTNKNGITFYKFPIIINNRKKLKNGIDKIDYIELPSKSIPFIYARLEVFRKLNELTQINNFIETRRDLFEEVMNSNMFISLLKIHVLNFIK